MSAIRSISRCARPALRYQSRRTFAQTARRFESSIKPETPAGAGGASGAVAGGLAGGLAAAVLGVSSSFLPGLVVFSLIPHSTLGTHSLAQKLQ